ncbi:hypothetical protein NDU88_002587 [Pleurodeles waltl]|uniref:Uncharacterized protein n=1 Tax=Pleurodeles waltl TaxID=8319 RepID=A0AAV7T2U6_PLEWA|nr:hypothetical protein NDU88_002587 [Pleurodeles waltl]
MCCRCQFCSGTEGQGSQSPGVSGVQGAAGKASAAGADGCEGDDGWQRKREAEQREEECVRKTRDDRHRNRSGTRMRVEAGASRREHVGIYNIDRGAGGTPRSFQPRFWRSVALSGATWNRLKETRAVGEEVKGRRGKKDKGEWGGQTGRSGEATKKRKGRRRAKEDKGHYIRGNRTRSRNSNKTEEADRRDK